MTEELERALRSAWSLETTWCPEVYEGKHPSYGCCGVTSFAIWMLTKQPIVRGQREGRLHYWNEYLDLTSEQFSEVSPVFHLGSYLGWEYITVNDMMPNQWLRQRAALYLHRVLSA